MAINARSVWVEVWYRRPFAGAPSVTTLSFRRPPSVTTPSFSITTPSCKPRVGPPYETAPLFESAPYLSQSPIRVSLPFDPASHLSQPPIRVSLLGCCVRKGCIDLVGDDLGRSTSGSCGGLTRIGGHYIKEDDYFAVRTRLLHSLPALAGEPHPFRKAAHPSTVTH